MVGNRLIVEYEGVPIFIQRKRPLLDGMETLFFDGTVLLVPWDTFQSGSFHYDMAYENREKILTRFEVAAERAWKDHKNIPR